MIFNLSCHWAAAMLGPNSVDAIVTDPPYELEFMGKKWDGTGVAFDPETWRVALEVLKPGGHLLAFSGSRTYHRMACAIEDAGFEIRDQIMWVYGSGFPKSLDVSKAIDKARRRDYVLAAVALGMEIPGNNLHDWTKAEHSPGDKWWAEFKAVLSIEQWGAIEREVVGQQKRGEGRQFADGASGFARGTVELTAPATDAARQWQGWGTALKPAHEPIVVARKPLVGTVAANVLAHGTGALNIDGCRIAAPGVDLGRNNNARTSGTSYVVQKEVMRIDNSGGLGRWPANLIHDGSDEVLAAFPQAPGQMAKASTADTPRNGQHIYGAMTRGSNGAEPRADAGSAARFFYCAKSSKSDRGEGNTHPTVKPTDLMRYLCRLVTPPGGTVLDPFTGSGSTGKAAVLEGFTFIGFELDPDYIAIAEARIAAARSNTK